MRKFLLLLVLLTNIYCQKDIQPKEGYSRSNDLKTDKQNIQSMAVNQMDPGQIVKLFCDRDFNGVRLKAHNMELTTWHAEPGWDGVVIIKDYKITSCSIENEIVVVSVKYYILGTCYGDELNKAMESDTEEAIFKVLKTDNGWKIDDPQLVPHVSVKTVINNISELLKLEEKESERINILKANLTELETWGIKQ